MVRSKNRSRTPAKWSSAMSTAARPTSIQVTVSGPSFPVVLPGSGVTLRLDEIGRFHPGEVVSPMRLSGMQVPVSVEAAMVNVRQAPQVEAAVVDAVVDLQDVVVRPPGY